MNLLVLLYASGFVLVPGAILGLGLALARPRTRGELVFGAMTLFLAGFLLLEAGPLRGIGAGPGALRLLLPAAGRPLLRPLRGPWAGPCVSTTHCSRPESSQLQPPCRLPGTPLQ